MMIKLMQHLLEVNGKRYVFMIIFIRQGNSRRNESLTQISSSFNFSRENIYLRAKRMVRMIELAMHFNVVVTFKSKICTTYLMPKIPKVKVSSLQ